MGIKLLFQVSNIQINSNSMWCSPFQSHDKLWLEIADKVTMAVQQIIEFSKMVPGFMNLLQDDQIMLLKGGSFEIALLRLCRAYDVQTKSVIFGNQFVPTEAFSNLSKYTHITVASKCLCICIISDT